MEVYLADVYLPNAVNLLLLDRLTVNDTDSFPWDTEYTWVVGGSPPHGRSLVPASYIQCLLVSGFPTPSNPVNANSSHYNSAI